MTARWVVDGVAAERDLRVVWQPISLLVKNRPDEGTPGHQAATVGHRCLRIMEAIRVRHGDDAVQRWYWQCATRIHHDGERPVDLDRALDSAGFEPDLAAAADDDGFDDEIMRRMNDGLALVGDDVGTPIIAVRSPDGRRHGVFGPVITRVPDRVTSARLWDAMEVLMTTDGFWELKRTRSERPEFGDRPDV